MMTDDTTDNSENETLAKHADILGNASHSIMELLSKLFEQNKISGIGVTLVFTDAFDNTMIASYSHCNTCTTRNLVLATEHMQQYISDEEDEQDGESEQEDDTQSKKGMH